MMDLNLEKEIISSLEKKINSYGFIKDKVVLKGTVHIVNFVLNSNKINFNLLFRILPKRLKYEVYINVEYLELSNLFNKIELSDKFIYTFTGKLVDFLEPKNNDWFHNTTCVEDEKFDLVSDDDIGKTVDYIENKYIKTVVDRIIPKINSLEKLNMLLNDFDLVYDEKHNEPKMFVLSGGMIFQSISALILNTIYNNPKREKLINMYSWLFYVIKDEEDIDKVMLKKVLSFVETTPAIQLSE